MQKTRRLILAGMTAAALAGCQGAERGQVERAREVRSGDVNPPSRGAVVAMAGREPVYERDLWADVMEAAGGEALLDYALDQGLAARLRLKEWKVDQGMVEAEKEILLRAMGAESDGDQAQRLLNDLRAQRGLGERRWQALLVRNARLRRLVQEEVVVSDAAVRQAYEVRYGLKYEVRLITVDTLGEATQVIQRARAGESFPDLAIARSTDMSKAQGGLIGAVSAEDTSYPGAVRKALTAMAEGEVSDPVALDQGFAVLKLERKIGGAAVQFDDVKMDLERNVRRQVERMLMQRLAREIISQADVAVMDQSLQAGFARRKAMLLAAE